MPQQERVNIAVFIDFDNIEIGVKTTLGEHFDIGTILEALKERGEVVTKIAYADWTRAGEYSRALTNHAIRLVQRNLTPGGDKNGADINLALDALEMAFTHPHINAYVIVGGDSDFLSLVEKLKQYDKKVFVVGGRAFTSTILQRNCHEFIAYENLVRKTPSKGGRPLAAAGASPLAQAFPLVRRALKILADREVSPQTGLLKSTLLQLDSTFSERNYGASSFLDFAEKLAQAGLVQLKHAGRSVMVELNSTFDDGESTVQVQEPRAGAVETRPGVAERDSGEAGPPGIPQISVAGGDHGGRVRAEEPPPQAGDTAAGVATTADLLRSAAGARWPMYLRNFKQILRAGGFDERRYGFGGLMDLLRACGREGLIRLERDRRGGLRVFQGAALARTIVPAAADVVELVPQESAIIAEPPSVELPDSDAELVEAQPIAVVDTTAELLGRATSKRPRSRAASGRSLRPAVHQKAAAKKPAAAGRRTRSKKAGSRTSGDESAS